VALGLIIFTSACSTASENRDDNFERSELFTDISSQTDFGAPSDVSGISGSVTYNGVAFADFGEFRGTADATVNADFDTNDISGSMTSWTDTDSDNYELRGQVRLSNGTIFDDGSFTSAMAGNIERYQRGSGSVTVDDLIVFDGAAGGQFFNSLDGSVAGSLTGAFTGVTESDGVVTGEFIAE
jgi:hypothetical protein